MDDKDKKENTLDNLPGKNPFEVPANYFESFPSRLQDRINLEKVHGAAGKQGIFMQFKPYFALAAMIVGFTVIGYTGFRFILNKHLLQNTLPEEEIISYLHSNTGYFYDDQLYEIDLEEEVYEIEEEFSEEIIEYLVDDEVDYGILVNELQLIEVDLEQ